MLLSYEEGDEGEDENLVKQIEGLNHVYAPMKVLVTARMTVRLIVESEVRIQSYLAPVPMGNLGPNLRKEIEIDLQKKTDHVEKGETLNHVSVRTERLMKAEL